MIPLIGNESARDTLARAIGSRALHHAWLLTGPEGVGKGRFARDAALRMLAVAADGAEGLPPGIDVPEENRIARLFAARSHPDYRELVRLPKDADKPGENIARSIKIDQVRQLIASFSTKPSLSQRRVVVIDSIDDVERPGAANALLKVLEEPPEGTVFLLVSHAPGRLLPTIRSRCRTLRFEPLEDAQVQSALRPALPDASDDELAALVRAGDGSPGRALGFAGLDMAALERELETLAMQGDPTNAVRSRLARMLGTKAAQARYEAFLERTPSFIAEHAKSRNGAALRRALDSYAAARDLGGMAVGLSLDASATVFEMAGMVARLAQERHD
ncbi:DNA polymerase III subunit delta' [Stakelama tenebrarum]|uniref:DNA polymerase III subunit delta n=1 Tax=Stakelama tenebrarum TaxID=2711215 RepID=A0A6G6Y618_9SPHN|nr:DNA polymerase III subunit delta' [Sphingosinithalassobacter tenebrarum]QIG80291.1 DNA polymerase III subunit delta' [Sphingosinithalassobacter tenebrarum]